MSSYSALSERIERVSTSMHALKITIHKWAGTIVQSLREHIDLVTCVVGVAIVLAIIKIIFFRSRRSNKLEDRGNLASCQSCKGTGTIRVQYFSPCTTCNGSGEVPPERPSSTGTHQAILICPECHGKKEHTSLEQVPCPRCRTHRR